MSENSEREWLPLELIKTTSEYLAKKSIPTPRLDAEVLLCSVLDCTRVKLYTIYDETLSSDQLGLYRDMVRRRVAREPVSRILGKREFMGLNFIVTPEVLSPRPDTEILVEKAISILEPAPKTKRSEKFFQEWDKKNIELLKEQVAGSQGVEIPQEVKDILEAHENGQDSQAKGNDSTGSNTRSVLDLGTGSGCIPISIIKHSTNVKAVGVDISTGALEVARENAEKLGASDGVEFVESDFFAALNPQYKFDIIMSNPPYLVRGDKEIWPEVVGYDPDIALYAEDNGLACYRRIIDDVSGYLAPRGWVLFELGAGQVQGVSRIVYSKYPDAIIETLSDHAGIDRVLVISNIVV